MSLVLVTGPTTEPLSLAEAKAHLRVDDSDSDVLIAGYILAARVLAEEHTGRKFVTQTYDLKLEEFDDVIELPVYPVQSITSVKYMTGGVETTLSALAYEANLGALEPCIRPTSGYAWPSIDAVYNAVTVRFVAGYATASDPELNLVRQAMMLMIGHWYENREAVSSGAQMNDVPLTVNALLAPLRTYR